MIVYNIYRVKLAIEKYRYKLFKCAEGDSKCTESTSETEWSPFTTPEPTDDPTGMCIDCIAYKDWLFMENGKYMFVTEAVDEYDNYREVPTFIIMPMYVENHWVCLKIEMEILKLIEFS